MRQKMISFSADTIKLDTLSLQANNIHFQTQDSQVISESKFFIDYAAARIYLLDPTYRYKPISVQYMVFPFNFSKIYSHKDLKEKGIAMTNEVPYIYKPLPEQQDVFGYSTLNRSGTFTRGISFGNNQDLVVNSFVDIQLSGKIAPDIEVLASLNDRNIPIQPEGTTAQIQNFDQKFISVTLPKQKVMLGDLQLVNQKENYFLKYNKKVQGITAQSYWNAGAKDSGFTSATASLTKGKWQRQVFNGIEGNQGPYRLQGSDGELYVIVVAGTERVILNGETLKRGEQNDYKIDYNTGELIFTANRLITKYDRIVVEFQYADRNYQRYLLHSYTEYKTEKWTGYFNFYHEQDNAQQPILATLKPDDKKLLARVGDSIQNALAPSGDSVAFSTDRVLYKKKDTAGYKGIYFFSTSPDSAHFQVSFSYLGQGHGNYKQIKALANGKVYGWVAPKDGIPQGDYEPVTKIVAPQKQQMITLGAVHQFGKKGKVGVEGAMSVRDANTMSDIDDGDNVGFAGRVFAENEVSLQKKEDPLKLQFRFDGDQRLKNYTEVERTRSPEFSRIWNRSLTNSTDFTDKADETFGSLAIKLFDAKKINFTNTSSIYTRSEYFRGIMENPVLRWQVGKYILTSSAELVFTNNTKNADSLHDLHTHKYTGDFSRSFKIFRLGLGGTEEQSSYYFNGQEIARGSNFKYDEARVYLSNDLGSKTIYGLELNERKDYTPYKNAFINSNTGENLIAKLYLQKNPERQLKLDFKYRNNVADTAIGLNVPKKKESTYLTHVEYLLNMLKGAANISSIYEISTGRELRRDFVYVQVAKGQGTHVWNDYNHNGLKEFNEFETAPFKDLGEYIRVIVPSAQYQNTLTNQYQQSIKLQPGKLFRDNSGLGKFASRFTDVANFSILNKLHTDPTLSRLNPFYTKVSDSELVTTSSLVRNVFYFNRTSPVWGADYTINNTTSKSFLVSGFDSRKNIDNTINVRWNISSYFTLEPTYVFSQHSFASDYFSTKDFLIHYTKQGGTLSWQYSQKLRLNLNYFYVDQHNILTDPFEKEYQHDGGFEARYNWLAKAIISARVDYISIKYAYDPGTPIAYEMLQGLHPGDNFTWNVSWNQRLQNSLQLTFSYEGRKSEGSKTINIGRANVTWFF